MEKIKKQVVIRLSELQKIKPRIYTALELRGKRPLLSRVQRKEMAIYYKEVQKQKHELKEKLGEIDYYLQKQKKDGKIKKPTISLKPIPKLVETRLKRYRKRRGH